MISAASSAASASDIRIRLPPNWRSTRDSTGRLYYFNRKTREVSWDPPTSDSDSDSLVVINERVIDVETASTASETEDNIDEEDGEDTDDEDEDDSDKEDDIEMKNHPGGPSSNPLESNEIVSDLSEEEKELLLRNYRKKSKEERQHERRQKREQNREKREYERKRRRERHGKHRSDGLVQEHIIPVSLMLSFFVDLKVPK